MADDLEKIPNVTVIEIDEEDEFSPPPPTVRIGIDEWCFHNSMLINRITLEDMIALAGRLKLDGVGFDYFMMSKNMREDPERIVDLLKSNGLELVFGFGIPFALPDLAHQLLQNNKDEMFELAHKFGSSIIRVCGGLMIPTVVHKPLHLVFNRDREIADVSRRLKDFAEEASLEGFTLALENHGDYNIKEMLEILDRVDLDNFRITLDTGNSLCMDEDPLETAEKLVPFTVYTHIKDTAHSGPFLVGVPLGEGEIDLPAIIDTLKNYNYEGLYSIEVNLPLWKVDKEESSVVSSVEFLSRFKE